MKKLVMFDMDGVLFNSMPGHAKSWRQTFQEAGYDFDETPFFMNEGRTGDGTIRLLVGPDADYKKLYARKCEIFDSLPRALAMPGAQDCVRKVRESGAAAMVVTGSAQSTLLGRLESEYEGLFSGAVTAYDVKKGKPDPEPYLKGLEKAGVSAADAIVVENAPLGVMAGHASGCFVIAVNTGPLPDSVLWDAGADVVLPSMEALSQKIDDYLGMRTQCYEVAGHCFSLTMPEADPLWGRLGNYAPFVIDAASKEPVFKLICDGDASTSIALEKIELPPDEDPLMTRLDVFSPAGGRDFSTLKIEMAVSQSAPSCGSLLIKNLHPDGGSVPVTGKLDRADRFTVDNSLMVLYAFATADKDTLEMHSSVVMHNGRAYMFLGKSGTGKSTHSRLWLNNIEGTKLLNDDNPVIRVGEDGIARVYGSPWSGKTPCYVNDFAPIGGIVDLHQAPFNRISRQDLPQAYASIYSSCSGLKYDSASSDALHESICKTVTSVPCFDLDCLPDRDAALLCRSTLED